MKHLFIFCSQTKSLPKEYDDLIRIQVDNSLDLGANPRDIVLAFNFPYEYRGIKSVIIGDYEVFDQNRSTKVPVIIELFEKNLIEDDMYWFHDFDALQFAPFELEFPEGKDAAFTTHGAFDPVMWNAGSFFFNNNSKDIFEWIYGFMNKLNTNEQRALTHMWEANYNGINARCEILDPSYNLIIYKIPENIKLSTLPIKVAHFHPHKKRHLELFKSRGLLPENLLAIFRSYGIQ